MSLRVYIKSEPGKYGIKIWVCATETGYIVVCQIYTGKSKDGPEKGQGMRVVKDLVAAYLNEGREVTADNLFTCVEFLRACEFFCGLYKQRTPEQCARTRRIYRQRFLKKRIANLAQS